MGSSATSSNMALLNRAPLQTYEPYLQMPFSGVTLVVRTEGNPASLSGAIRSEVLAIDKEQPVSRIRTLDQIISGSVQQQRFLMLLLGVFAAVALILAAVGLYGVMNYAVTQRTHEIGIRMALGASAGNVLRLIVGHGMMLALIGVAIGLAGAFAVTRLMATSVVLDQHNRPADLRGHFGAAHRSGSGGLFGAGAPSDQGGPDARAEARID